jgi:hypothetical protein
MSEAIVTINPSGYIPADLTPVKPGPIHLTAWLLFLLAGAVAFLAALKILFINLPAASPMAIDDLSIGQFTLQLLGCLLSGGAVGLAPRTKPAQGLSVLLLALNVLAVVVLIASGPLVQSATH